MMMGVLRECAVHHWAHHKDGDGSYGAAVLGLEMAGAASTCVDGFGAAVLNAIRAEGAKQRLSPATVNRRISALKTAFEWARDNGLHDFPTPKNTRPLKESSGRTRVVSNSELHNMAGVLEVGANPHSRAMPGFIEFLYETGLRVSEALALTYGDVRCTSPGLNPVSVRVRDSKNGSPREVPLSAGAVRALDFQFPVAPSTPLWGFTQAEFNRAWAVARRKVGLHGDKEFVPHALRHSCASRLVAAGVPLPVVKKWMGHKSIQTTMRYAHVNDAQLADAARALQAKQGEPQS
jgi:integrase